MNLPNKLTTIRMTLVVLLIILLAIPFETFGITIPIVFGNVNVIYFNAALIFLIASITDYFDGYLARKLNLVTNYGKFMDPIADKLLVNSLLIFLVVKSFPGQITIPVVFVVLMIGRDIIVDGFRLVASSQNRVMAANIFGKLKTVLQMIAIIMYLFNDWPFNMIYGTAFPYVSFIFMALATIVSLLSGVIYIVQNIEVLKDTKWKTNK